jgi:hypothetical protein
VPSLNVWTVVVVATPENGCPVTSAGERTLDGTPGGVCCAPGVAEQQAAKRNKYRTPGSLSGIRVGFNGGWLPAARVACPFLYPALQPALCPFFIRSPASAPTRMPIMT